MALRDVPRDRQSLVAMGGTADMHGRVASAASVADDPYSDIVKRIFVRCGTSPRALLAIECRNGGDQNEACVGINKQGSDPVCF